MIASLPMYMRPELHKAHFRYWCLIRSELNRRGVQGPAQLADVDEPMQLWCAPDLVLAQTCGMPYRLYLHNKVKLVGTPDYALQGCAAGHYRSAIVVRQSDDRCELHDFSADVLAFNQQDSQSGYAAAFTHCMKYGFWFSQTLETGAHAASAQAVLNRQADIAFIDAVTWQLLQRYEQPTNSLRVLEWTAPTPGLPYITSLANDSDRVFSAVKTAIALLSDEDRALLLLNDIVQIPAQEYLSIPNPDK